jgi:hypothetical protein
MEMLEALIKRYEGEIAVAQATIRIYMNNSVGIGEHPQHAEEIDTLLATIADRQDKIEAAVGILDTNLTVQNLLNESSSA